MDKFLETHSIIRLNHEGRENLNKTITSKEIVSVIKNLPIDKRPGPDSFNMYSTKCLKKD